MIQPPTMIVIVLIALITTSCASESDNGQANTTTDANPETKVIDRSYSNNITDDTEKPITQPQKQSIKQKAQNIGNKVTETTKDGVEVVKKGYDKSKKGLKKGYEVTKEKTKNLKDKVVEKTKDIKEKVSEDQ